MAGGGGAGETGDLDPSTMKSKSCCDGHICTAS